MDKIRTSVESIRSFEMLVENGVEPSQKMSLAALKACSSLGDLQAGKRIHACLIDNGQAQNINVASCLVHMYSTCRSMSDARSVFGGMPQQDTISWNTLIFGYITNQSPELALELFFHLMQTEASDRSCQPNARTFVAALKACAAICSQGNDLQDADKLEWLRVGRWIHFLVLRGGHESNVFVSCTLVDVYVKCGRADEAYRVFDGCPDPDLVSWNAVLFGYAEAGDGVRVLELLHRMRDEGCEPDSVTFVAALKACGVCSKNSSSWLRKGKELHSQALKLGFDRDLVVASTLVDLYVSSGALREAREVFQRMVKHDVVSWNALIFGHAENGEPEMALELFARMQHEGFAPNALTFVAAMKACGCLSDLETGRVIHEKICRAGVERVTYAATSLVDFYGKCGAMRIAQLVFDAAGSRHLAMWNSLVAGYSDQGDSLHSFMLFEKMLEEGMRVDAYSFLSILTLCSRVGLLEVAKKYFEGMQQEHLISPQLEHYNCMVDLFCRANRLKEAVALVENLEPNIAFWRTILGACHKWNNVEVGKLVFDRCVKLNDQEPVFYVLMNNIYLNAGMEAEGARVQALKKQSLSKQDSHGFV